MKLSIFNPMRKKVRCSADAVRDSVIAQSCEDNEAKLRRVGDVVRVISGFDERELCSRAVITGFRQSLDGRWWFSYTEVRDPEGMLTSSQGAHPFHMVYLR